MEKKSGNYQTISWLYDLYKRNLLDLNPSYQRRSVWNQIYKDFFIDTILMGYPCPPIFLYEEISEYGIAKYSVVDGKQRLTSIFEFIEEKYPIYENIIKKNLAGKFFSEIERTVKIDFYSYNLSIEYLPTNDESIIKDIFQRLNKNIAKLTPQELRHAKFDGFFLKEAESLTEWMSENLAENIPKFSRSSINKMIDVEFTAQLLLLIDDGVKGYLQDELDIEFNKRDLLWEKRDVVVNNFKSNISIINKIISIEEKDMKNSRIKNQADFYGLFGAIHSIIEKDKLDLKKVNGLLLDFYNTIDDEDKRKNNKDAEDYYETIRSNTNKTIVRIDRVNLLKKIITV